MPAQEHQQPVQNRSEEGAGPIVGAIIIVILLVFGALYFWGQKLNKQPTSDAPLVRTQINVD